MATAFPDTLTLADITTSIRGQAEFKTIRHFLESKGFGYEPIILPGDGEKIYNFSGLHEHSIISLSGEAMLVNDIILVRRQSDSPGGKLTILTPLKEYYEHFVAQLRNQKFVIKDQSDKNKAVKYASENVPGVTVTLASTQAIKESKPYLRYTIAIDY